jgi:hypothetical protein
MFREYRSNEHNSHQWCGALACLHPLELLVNSEARSAVLRLWSLGTWSYLHLNWGHGSILVRLQQLNSIINMGLNVMRQACNFEPKLGLQCWLGNNDWLTDYIWVRGLNSHDAPRTLLTRPLCQLQFMEAQSLYQSTRRLYDLHS